MKLINNRIIHRFIKDRSEYEQGGSLFDQIIPVGVQAYSYQLKENGNPDNPDDYIVRYVLGTGSSTYMEIANGHGKDEDGNFLPELSKEYLVTSLVQIEEIIKEATEKEIDSKITHLKELSEEYALEHPGEIVQYIGETTIDYIEGYFYQSINGEWERVSVQPETDLTPVWEAIEQLDENKVEKTNESSKIYGTDENGDQTTYDVDELGLVDDVQVKETEDAEYVTVVDDEVAYIDLSKKITHYTTLPEPSEDKLGQVVQYVGPDTEDYKNGLFYKVVVSGEPGEEVYSWLKVDTTDISEKVDKIHESNRIYGTDSEGNQTTYDKEDFGKVDDVRLFNITTGEYESVVEDKIALLAPEAVDIAYTNDQYPTMQTLQDAMDKLLYITPSVSISGGSTRERGESISSVTVNWTWNKKIVSQSLSITGQSAISLDPSVRTYTYTPATPITSNTTFTISGTDGTTSKSASTSITYIIKKYYGASEIEEPTDAQIRSLINATTSRTLASTTFNFGTGKYWYYCIPKDTDIGAALVFSIGPAGSEALQSGNYFIYEKNDFKNAQGVTIPLRIYKFKKTPEGNPDKLTGTLNVKVS